MLLVENEEEEVGRGRGSKVWGGKSKKTGDALFTPHGLMKHRIMSIL